MKIVKLIHFVPKDAPTVSTPAFNRRLIER